MGSTEKLESCIKLRHNFYTTQGDQFPNLPVEFLQTAQCSGLISMG